MYKSHEIKTNIPFPLLNVPLDAGDDYRAQDVTVIPKRNLFQGNWPFPVTIELVQAAVGV